MDCQQGPYPHGDSGPRPMPPRYVIVHSTESPNPGASGVAQGWAAPSAEGSAHVVVDDQRCIRCLPDTRAPWAAPPLNFTGLHIEQCGRAEWSRAEWLAHLSTIQRTAAIVAGWCDAYGIPKVWLSAADLRAGKHGITSHKIVNDVYHQSDHWDPGPNYPTDIFMAAVRGEEADVTPDDVKNMIDNARTGYSNGVAARCAGQPRPTNAEAQAAHDGWGDADTILKAAPVAGGAVQDHLHAPGAVER